MALHELISFPATSDGFVTDFRHWQVLVVAIVVSVTGFQWTNQPQRARSSTKSLRCDAMERLMPSFRIL